MALGVVRDLDTVNSAPPVTINAVRNSTVFADNRLVVVITDTVTSHGDAPGGATMVGGSTIVFARKTAGGFLGVCRIGDAASCSHVALTGSTVVFAN